MSTGTASASRRPSARTGATSRRASAPDAVSAAREWSTRTRPCSSSIRPTASRVDTQPFIGTTNDYAIVFRQQADGVEAHGRRRDRRLVGSKVAGWNGVYASSSLTGGSADATGSDDLAPAVAWTEAANDVGVDVSVVDVAPESTRPGRRRSRSTASAAAARQEGRLRDAASRRPRRLRRDRHADAGGTWRATRSSSMRRPATCSTGRTSSTTSPTTRPGWPRGTRCRSTPQRLPVELPDHGQPLAPLLDADCGVRRRRE